MSKETDPKGTPRKARRQGVDRKGLENERGGNQREKLESLWGKISRETDLRKQGRWRRGREVNPGKRQRGKEYGHLHLLGRQDAQMACYDVICSADARHSTGHYTQALSVGQPPPFCRQ